MLKNSQAVRFSMAAGMYLLLMWGYIVLPSAQSFAAFLALILCAMLVFWVSESLADLASDPGSERKTVAGPSRQGRHGVTMTDWGSQTRADGSLAPAPFPIWRSRFCDLNL